MSFSNTQAMILTVILKIESRVFKLGGCVWLQAQVFYPSATAPRGLGMSPLIVCCWRSKTSSSLTNLLLWLRFLLWVVLLHLLLWLLHLMLQPHLMEGAWLWPTFLMWALLPLVSLLLLRTNTSQMKIFAGLGMKMVWILMQCLVLQINLTALLPLTLLANMPLSNCLNVRPLLHLSLFLRHCFWNASSSQTFSILLWLVCWLLPFHLILLAPSLLSTLALQTTNKLAFISNKHVANLQVWMENNSHLLVIGQEMVVIFLNGQRILICHALAPGSAVQLYSLQAHFKQQGCGFIGTFESGMTVYFPTFVILVNALSGYHLSYESWPLSSLGYSSLCPTRPHLIRLCTPLPWLRQG